MRSNVVAYYNNCFSLQFDDVILINILAIIWNILLVCDKHTSYCGLHIHGVVVPCCYWVNEEGGWGAVEAAKSSNLGFEGWWLGGSYVKGWGFMAENVQNLPRFQVDIHFIIATVGLWLRIHECMEPPPMGQIGQCLLPTTELLMRADEFVEEEIVKS